MKDVFVARQPIFDANNKVVGHELLYRSHEGMAVADGTSASAMSSTIMVDAILGTGLDLLTEGERAFINFSSEMLLMGAPELLDPDRIVVEVLENVEPTQEILAKLRKLSELGHTLALDDFVFRRGLEPMLELASIVKVDVEDCGDDLADVAEGLRPYGVQLLAEKVETQDVHDHCVSLGFELFQGFHYVRPETLTGRNLPAQSVAIIRLMNLVQDASIPDRVVEEGFKVDPALTYKLLRIVNSAALGGRGVDSIGHAMRLLGREPLHRWLSLLLMTVEEGSGMRTELVKNALLRARMCELLGDHVRSVRNHKIPSGGALFLVGLFSQADQLMGTPMETILADVDVSADVRAALLERQGPAGVILSTAEAYGDAEWDRATRELAALGTTGDALPDAYLEALGWAADRLRSRVDTAA